MSRGGRYSSFNDQPADGWPDTDSLLDQLAAMRARLDQIQAGLAQEPEPEPDWVSERARARREAQS